MERKKIPQFPSCYLQKIQLSPNCSKRVGCRCKLKDKGHNKIFVLLTKMCQRCAMKPICFYIEDANTC